MFVTRQQLMQIMRHASHARLALFEKPLNEAMQRYDIATLQRVAAFIAQLAHESGEFRYMEEIWGPTKAQERYEPESRLAQTLGNTHPGDGKRFKGRGPIQLTGRDNYRRYGELLGVDLIELPELAATPEIGFSTAGLFWQKNGLNELADAGDLKAITKRINEGYNGLAERQHFYDLALQQLVNAFPATAPQDNKPPPEPASDFPRGAEAIREASAEADQDAGGQRNVSGQRAGKGKSRSNSTSFEHNLDARPDTMDFRDRMFEPTLVEVPTHIPLGNYLDYDVPILDQGQEGACTGYGLATVANYLLRRRRVVPDPQPVSARMLYDLARRYDEWPGEDYSGSSARGAIKGWHKHGVCPEELYPSDRPDPRGLNWERTSEARRRPLGAYFRVNHKDLVAMHSAIAEVGILYATCAVHTGWNTVGPDGLITMTEQIQGGHAFAIVAYDDGGFWLQNSWGPAWGRGGFARISYDDWLRNGTDVWVARLGAPVTLYSVESTATAHAVTSGESVAYTYVDLRPHIVSVGNDGYLRAGGDYGVTADELQLIFKDDIPRVTEGWDKVRILLYAHGGLVSESSAVQRLAEYRAALLGGEVYPLAFIWRSDLWTTITNILADAMRRRRPEGWLDESKDFMLDRLDDALEPVARILGGRLAWQEMKENALAAGKPSRAAWQVAGCLAVIKDQPWLKGRDVEIHLASHSAGSILHSGLVSTLVENGMSIESCTLWAPACTVNLFNRRYLPAIKSGHLKQLNLFALSDKAEQDDHCARIYNKSLLYLVSHAFEDKVRIPGFRDGEPILGMERWLDKKVRALFSPDGPHRLIIAPNSEASATGYTSQARSHGDFDDDHHTVASTFAAITGLATTRVAQELGEPRAGKNPQFHRNSSSLRTRRLEIDAHSEPDARR
ncbi:hypothetical protein KG088_17535 [Halomonas sp. TRM85114]|uniref:glycoside hydrolase family 19 protein n=1 Tax=Halomonas jincaotanensis TaxID=2810616 RepID=UPI001BD2C9F8|nr:glycoside hydrolase family 19 protein [Halomonas jincaotanensis]MBS9405413.1 hypothetical protein [Halomonas jincaotanensis]